MGRGMRQYRLRAHHGMCLLFFEGKGYSDSFTEHMASVREGLMSGAEVVLTAGTDDICGGCPNNRGGMCESASKTERYDRLTMQTCGIEEGDALDWAQLQRLVKERIIRAGKREGICGDCQWNAICMKKEKNSPFPLP